MAIIITTNKDTLSSNKFKVFIMTTITKNKEQRLYVLNHDKFVTCLGFDVAFERVQRLHEELSPILAKALPPMPKYKGTMKVYNTLQRLQKFAHAIHTQHGIQFKAELTKQLIGLEGKRVEVVDSYGETRRFKVGKSTGWIPCHLELANARSSGGISVMGAPFKSVRVVG